MTYEYLCFVREVFYPDPPPVGAPWNFRWGRGCIQFPTSENTSLPVFIAAGVSEAVNRRL